jgi:hypothetical protein
VIKISTEGDSDDGRPRPPNKQLALSISFAKDTITRGSTQTVIVTVTDASTKSPISGASVSITVAYASGGTKKSFSGMTDTSGKVSFSFPIGGKSTPGIFTVSVHASKSSYQATSAKSSFKVIEAAQPGPICPEGIDSCPPCSIQGNQTDIDCVPPPPDPCIENPNAEGCEPIDPCIENPDAEGCTPLRDTCMGGPPGIDGCPPPEDSCEEDPNAEGCEDPDPCIENPSAEGCEPIPPPPPSPLDCEDANAEGCTPLPEQDEEEGDGDVEEEAEEEDGANEEVEEVEESESESEESSNDEEESSSSESEDEESGSEEE